MGTFDEKLIKYTTRLLENRKVGVDAFVCGFELYHALVSVISQFFTYRVGETQPSVLCSTKDNICGRSIKLSQFSEQQSPPVSCPDVLFLHLKRECVPHVLLLTGTSAVMRPAQAPLNPLTVN